MSGIGAIPPVFSLAMWRGPKARGGSARQISLSRRGLFNIYLCSRSQIISSANGDLISGFKIAEYFDQVNPLMIRRSAALDINPFDRAVADANDECALGGSDYRRWRREERWPRSLRGPDRFGKHPRRQSARRICDIEFNRRRPRLRVE